MCTCTKHAHPYCQPTTNQLQTGDRPDELSHATFKRCICCLLKVCIFCSDWYWTFTLMSCLSISARLSSSCNTTWSHLLRFQVRFKHNSGLTERPAAKGKCDTPQQTASSLCCLDPGPAEEPDPTRSADPCWPHEISVITERERQQLKRQSVEMLTV